MNLKPFILFCSVFALIMLYESCIWNPSGSRQNCYCDPAHTLHSRFITSGIVAYNLIAQDSTLSEAAFSYANIDTTTTLPTVAANRYLIQFLFNYNQTICHKQPQWPHLLATAAADPIPCPDPAGAETIDSIKLTTRYDFDNLHPAGSNINDMFTIVWNESSFLGFKHKMRLVDFMLNANKPIETPTLIAHLDTKPDTDRYFQVNAHIKLSSGLTVNLTSKKLFLVR
jgi:hypothetical protein